MKLFHVAASPYSRKVRAIVRLLGLEDQIELVAVSLDEPSVEWLTANPLGQVPTLVTHDGATLYDSRVIVSYLNAVGGASPVLPPPGAALWLTLKQEALGDGISDAAILMRRLVRSGVPADNPLVLRKHEAIRRSLDVLELRPPGHHVDVGKIAIACALDFLDTVSIEGHWRDSRPMLAEWFAGIITQDCLAVTA